MMSPHRAQGDYIVRMGADTAMRPVYFILLLLSILLAGCQLMAPPLERSANLQAARRGFKTALLPSHSTREPVDQPPPAILRLVKYPAPSGELAAYLTPDPGDGRKHPAIVWITGGDCNSIGDVWSPVPRQNDQSASAYREAGIVMMYPSLRGGNDNPGVKEGFLGEVDDVLAATDYLEKQPYVDPNRIYLGGHSTGGTLTLLVAEYTSRYRAVFSFGPVYDVAGYGANSGFVPADLSNHNEVVVRSPGYWLSSIKSPVWVFEGANGQVNNISELRRMNNATDNPKVHFVEVRTADHFSILAPTNALIAAKILADTGPTCSLSFPETQ